MYKLQQRRMWHTAQHIVLSFLQTVLANIKEHTRRDARGIQNNFSAKKRKFVNEESLPYTYTPII
jgi:hypothetical protein